MFTSWHRSGSCAPLPSLGARDPSMPHELVEIVGRLLCKRKSERYQNAGEVIADLQAFLQPKADRYTEDKSAFPGIQEMGKKSFYEYMKQIDAMYAKREWLSDKYSVLDPYAFVFYTWGAKRGQPMGELKNFTAAKDRMLKRPAVQRVVADEGVKV